MIDLSIITVSYNSEHYIDRCILSVITHTLHCSYEHIIVDNASTDGTIELIETAYSSFVHLIKNKKNVGFSAANNQAAHRAQGRYLLFLNPDMELFDGYLDTLIEWMDHRPDVGLIGCKLLCAMKTPCTLLRPHQFFTVATCLGWILNMRSNLPHPKFSYSDFDDDVEREVDIVRGSFMFVKKQIIDHLGFAFDPKYFILFEDLDLCREIKRLKFKIAYVPRVSCIDYHGRSFRQRTNAWRDLNLLHSFKTYALKWHNPLHQLWLPLAIFLGLILRIPRWTHNAWQLFIKRE